MKKYFLEIVVFICGAVVMIYEIVGSRILGPYLGTSIFIWTSLIGIILGSLSLGYWLGGRLADRNPAYSALAWIILCSAIFIGFSTLIKELFLNYLPRIIDGLKWQSVTASVVLFAPASIFLGMVSPYAVRLKIKALQTSGTTVGNLYAISTVGSIAGTFAAGFFLIPALGTTNILIIITILLALLSIALFIAERKTGKGVPALILIILTCYLFFQDLSTARTFIDEDTRYNRVWIYDAVDPGTGKTVKYMRINNESSSAMFPDSDELVFPYLQFFRVAEHFTPGFRSALLLGGAAFSYPTYFLDKYPDAAIDVVEIDPDLTRIAREHFRMKDNPRMRIFHEDARTYLNRNEYKYDVIFGDTFKSLYTLPWHLTTRETAQKTFNMLNEGGCAVLNLISSVTGDASLFLQAELATYREIFPHVFVFAVMDPTDLETIQSTVLVASKSPNLPVFENDDPVLSEYLRHDVTSHVGQTVPVLTDEYAPVDYYTNKAVRMIGEAGTQGGKPLLIALSKGSPDSSYANYYNWIHFLDSTVECRDMYALPMDSALRLFRECSGLVLTGGTDINPAFYNRAFDTVRCWPVDDHRDNLELTLIDSALARGMPILGICRGHQVLNVALGGSLIVDIPSDHGTSLLHQCDNYLTCFHNVFIDTGSILYEITGTLSGEVNSNHHQAVDEMAPPLKAVAFSPDGLIEAEEWKNPEGKSFLIGVQWHPERMERANPLSIKAGERFINECRKFGQRPAVKEE